jgi:hypothetical protein
MKVWNRASMDAPKGAVYVGRPGKWGNPFVIRETVTRSEVIQAYAVWIKTQPKLLAQLHELKGKDLVCWCAPLPCHADVLMEIANQGGPK